LFYQQHCMSSITLIPSDDHSWMFTTSTTSTTTLTTSTTEEVDAWPHNATTYVYSVIAFTLLMLTLITYISLLQGSLEYIKNREMNKNPHSPKSIERRIRLERALSSGPKTRAQEWQPISPSIFNLTFIASTLLIAANIFTFIYIINSQIYGELYTGGGSVIFQSITYCQVIAFGSGKILCHCIFIMRLFLTFKDAPTLRYPNWVFITMGVFIVISVATVLVLVPMSSMIAHELEENFTFIFCGIAVLLFFFDFSGALLILLLMLKKLHQLFIARKSCSQKELVSNTVTFHEVDEQMLFIIVKLTLLSLLSAFGGLCLFIAFLIRFVEDYKGNVKAMNIWTLVYPANIFLMFSAMINIMALYFILSFASKQYHKYCKCPHAFLRRSCKYGFKAAILRQRKQWRKHTARCSEISEMQTHDHKDESTTDFGGHRPPNCDLVPQMTMTEECNGERTEPLPSQPTARTPPSMGSEAITPAPSMHVEVSEINDADMVEFGSSSGQSSKNISPSAEPDFGVDIVMTQTNSSVASFEE